MSALVAVKRGDGNRRTVHRASCYVPRLLALPWHVVETTKAKATEDLPCKRCKPDAGITPERLEAAIEEIRRRGES